MNIHLIVASLLLYTTGISALNNVNTYSYSWSDPTTSNYYVTVPNDFATSFRLTFSANPSHDFSIGLYSHGYAIPYALGSYEPDAIVEYIVGGWDTGSNDSQHSAARFGVATESGFYKKEINFVDSATPHTQYIIPGERGSVITYIYTVILTSTNCTISLEYIDPTTEEIVPLLSTTQSDFPSDMLQQLQSTTFNGFTHVGFRAYDAPYAVTNATIGIPQQMLNAATHSIQTAQAACSEAMQTSLRNVNALAQDVVAAAQKLPRAIPTRAELIETAQTIQTTVTEPNLHYLNRALITLGTLPSYTTPIDAQRVKSTADTLTLQLTTIAQSCPETTDRLRTLSQQMTAALGTLGVFNRPYTQSGSYALTADLFTFNLIDKADNAGDLCIALYDDANNQLYKVSIGCKSNTTSKLSLLDPALATIYGDALWHNGQTTTINATTLSIATDMTGAASYTQSNPALVWDQTPF